MSLEERRIYMKAWHVRHREEQRVLRAIYNKAHHEEIAVYNAVWNSNYYAAHKEEEAACARIYHATHKTESAAGHKVYRTRHPEVHRASNARRARELRYVMLNSRFESCVGHHVDNEQVINMPTKDHISIPHDLKTGRNMGKINAVAHNFLFKQEVKAAMMLREVV
jgi:hypothetical protein